MQLRPNESPDAHGGKFCPSCGSDIGFWSVVRAGTPDRVRCWSCGTRLRYVGTGMAWLALGLVVLAAGSVAVAAAAGRPPLERTPTGSAVFVVVALNLLLPAELFVAWHLRRTGKLALGGAPAKDGGGNEG